MTSIDVSKKDASIRAIVDSTFPDYKGRKIRVEASEYPVNVTSYWSGGSRSYFAAIDLRTLKTLAVPQNGTPFDGGPIAPNGVNVPEGYAIIEHIIFSGKDLGIRIHINPSSLPKFIEAAK